MKKARRKADRKMRDLTIHFMSYSEIARESSLGRIKKIMGIVLKNKIVVLQGRLTANEEARLIENSMTLIGNIDGFAGIEIASLGGSSGHTMLQGLRRSVARMLVGEQDSLTVIGPASVVREMKKDPEKVELMLSRKI